MTKMPSQPLDVPRIQKMLSRKHREFMKAVGSVPIKVTADHQLIMTRMATKIARVLQCFVEEKVIDSYTPIGHNVVGVELSYRGFCVAKSGFDKTIYVWTDGNNIILRNDNFLIQSGLEDPCYKHIADININEYEWVDFAEALLEYIHVVIYDRQKSYETKIFGDN